MTLEQMKTIKKNFGISAREISEKTDIPFGTVQKIFTGETANPRFNTLLKLDEFFVELSLKYLNEMPEDKYYVPDHASIYNGDSCVAKNIQFIDYMEDAARLQFSADNSFVHNPNAQDIWISVNDHEPIAVPAGETVVVNME